MPGDPTCSAVQRLSQVGPHSAFVEIGAQCAGHAEARARMPAPPSRWAAVVWVPPRSKGGGPASASVHLALKLLDDAGIEGELALRQVRTGRVEVTQLWGRPESVRADFRRLRAQ